MKIHYFTQKNIDLLYLSPYVTYNEMQKVFGEFDTSGTVFFQELFSTNYYIPTDINSSVGVNYCNDNLNTNNSDIIVWCHKTNVDQFIANLDNGIAYSDLVEYIQATFLYVRVVEGEKRIDNNLNYIADGISAYVTKSIAENIVRELMNKGIIE